MKKIVFLLLCLLAAFALIGCAESTADGDIGAVPENGGEEEQMTDICPCIMVDGTLYYATGYKSTVSGRCGTMDGQITSTCAGTEVPTENGQSNFGAGYGYQYGQAGTIEIPMDDGNWYVYATEEVKATYQPQPDPNAVILYTKDGTVSGKQGTFVLQNNTEDKSYWYGPTYALEVRHEGEWQTVEPDEVLVWNAVAWRLEAGEQKEVTVDWSFGYGELESGTYRLVKTMCCEEDGASLTVGAAFEI